MEVKDNGAALPTRSTATDLSRLPGGFRRIRLMHRTGVVDQLQYYSRTWRRHSGGEHGRTGNNLHGDTTRWPQGRIVAATLHSAVAVHNVFSMKSLAIVFFGIMTAAAILGCGSDKLETGYHYRSLELSETQRKAMYSEPYSQNAAAAAERKR